MLAFPFRHPQRHEINGHPESPRQRHHRHRHRQSQIESGENLSKLYLDIARTYYGHDKKVCQVDDRLAIEWAYVPHFYYNFYVYQYATSMVASTSLARAVREETTTGKTARRDAYLKMLKTGSSQYAVEQLKDAGVDMPTSAPFDAAIACGSSKALMGRAHG